MCCGSAPPGFCSSPLAAPSSISAGASASPKRPRSAKASASASSFSWPSRGSIGMAADGTRRAHPCHHLHRAADGGGPAGAPRPGAARAQRLRSRGLSRPARRARARGGARPSRARSGGDGAARAAAPAPRRRCAQRRGKARQPATASRRGARRRNRARRRRALSAGRSAGPAGEPYAARGPERERVAAEQAEMAQIKGMVARLADRLKANPDDLEGWIRLGRSYAVLGERKEAEAAFAEAERLKPNDPEVLLAEAQAMMVGRAVADPIPDPVVTLLKRVAA